MGAKLRVPLPPYETPRNEWRKKIHRAASRTMRMADRTYSSEDRLALVVELHMTEARLGFHDVDNRLKDVLDALQGRVGGPKGVRTLTPLVPNDKQIFEVCVRKLAVPAGSEGGYVTITPIGRSSRRPRPWHYE